MTSSTSATGINDQALALLSQMSLDEKIHQMSGDQSLLSGFWELYKAYNARPIRAGENKRLGIPGVRFTDGPRGVVMYHSTCFPVSMGRGATWDPGLEAQVGDAIGVEARSQGANLFAGVCINLLRHPAWGRAQETYGEDPYLLGEMGTALVRGVQRHIMACVKHFAANSIENTRLKVNVHISERTLREVYLPHFKRCVDEGVSAVMSAYNQVNGSYCGHNYHLLSEILKGEWGFQGFIMSDFVFGIYDAKAAANAGLDLEMPLAYHYRRDLKKLVERGEVNQSIIDEAVHRILLTELRFAQVGEPARYSLHAAVSESHRALARQVAQKSIVLLKNEPVFTDANRAEQLNGLPLLPIDIEKVQRLALIGHLVTQPNVGDKGSSQVRPPYVVTPLQGIQSFVQNQSEILVENGRNIPNAAKIASLADLVLCVVGYTHHDEGEYIFPRGGDRLRLTLSTHDEALIQALADANPHIIVVLIGASAIITEAWRDRVPAILMAWYPGMEGGYALADILFGKVNPSGKLTCTFPKSNSQLPFFDRNAKEIEYGYYHGYRLLDKNHDEPAFPFGFGLSYTHYSYSNLFLDHIQIPLDGALKASILVTNTGPLAGDEVVQLYIGCPGIAVDRPVKELKGFSKVHLDPGEAKRLAFIVPVRQLAYYDEKSQQWLMEAGHYTVFVGPSSAAKDLLSSEFTIASD